MHKNVYIWSLGGSTTPHLATKWLNRLDGKSLNFLPGYKYKVNQSENPIYTPYTTSLELLFYLHNMLKIHKCYRYETTLSCNKRELQNNVLFTHRYSLFTLCLSPSDLFTLCLSSSDLFTLCLSSSDLFAHWMLTWGLFTCCLHTHGPLLTTCVVAYIKNSR